MAQADLTYTCYQMYVSWTQRFLTATVLAKWAALKLSSFLRLWSWHHVGPVPITWSLPHPSVGFQCRRTPTGLSPEYVNFNVQSGKAGLWLGARVKHNWKLRTGVKATVMPLEKTILGRSEGGQRCGYSGEFTFNFSILFVYFYVSFFFNH